MYTYVYIHIYMYMYIYIYFFMRYQTLHMRHLNCVTGGRWLHLFGKNLVTEWCEVNGHVLENTQVVSITAVLRLL